MTIRALPSIERVLVYAGHHTIHPKGGIDLRGPYSNSVDEHDKMFQAVNALKARRWEVQKVPGEDLASALRQADTSKTLLVIPAGESSSLDAAFPDETLEMIRDQIAHGMRLYATCGSVYWLAKTRIWNDRCVEKPESMEMMKRPGRVNIFSGTAIGPLSPYLGQTSGTAFFHEAARLTTSRTEATVLLSGGGTFLEDSPDQRLKTLATYAKETLRLHNKGPSWGRAIVSCCYQRGKVILSMVHPGYGREDINVHAYTRTFSNRNDDWQKIHDSLSSSEKRMQLVADILDDFDVRD